MQQMFIIADLIACTTYFRHHYAHHQELESIIQLVAACGIWCFGFQVVGMVWICNNKHLLHLVGILFPQISLNYLLTYVLHGAESFLRS